MRWTKALIPTLKEDPQEAEVISHKLMIRAGIVRKLMSGAYSYLPLGVRVLNKVKAIIKEEMDASGAQEVLLPSIQPPELWKKTGRYDILGPVLIKFKDRHGKELVMGPTHEEVVTGLVADNVRSYKDLPLILYQIQTKFRDEPRPRFGVMRTSEFIMKDAYSFDRDTAGMEESYQKMYKAYCRIFERCGLPFIPVEADPGMMGGNVSHEFMVPSEAGEDIIVVCKNCGYSASTQVARCVVTDEERGTREEGRLQMAEVSTLGVTTIEKVSTMLKIGPEKLVKTLLYKADEQIVALLLRGDFDANETKLKNYLKCDILELADENAIVKATGAPVGFSGPVGLKGAHILADYSVKGMSNFVTGANKKDAHLVNVNMGRDFDVKEFGDFRIITKDDRCPACGGPIEVKRAIEIGHTFKLGTKYSSALGAKFLDAGGKENTIIMGCYGIGVTRIIAALIEASNDPNGIIWPASVAPYQVVILALNTENEVVRRISDQLYDELTALGYEVLYDDRNVSAGIKFKDSDLIGIPIKIIVGEKNAKNGMVEIKDRKTAKIDIIPAKEAIAHLKARLR